MNIVEELRALVGHNGVMEAADVATRSAGAYRPDNLKAMALVRPANTDEVAAVMRWCHAHGVRVVTQGGLTGLVHGGDANADELILSLERMRTIEDINPVQRTATVQAGVTLQALQEAVEAHDLAYPLDLGARGTATLGGTAATNAGGNRVIRYGMTRDMVLGLEVVLADGTVVSSLNHLIKNNTGYDLKQLFIGSEGTLGVISEVTLRLVPKPPAVGTLLALFDHVRGAGAAVRDIVARGLVPRCLELLDATTLEAVRRSGVPIDRRAGAMLLIEVDGEPSTCEVEIERVGEACSTSGAIDGALQSMRCAHSDCAHGSMSPTCTP